MFTASFGKLAVVWSLLAFTPLAFGASSKAGSIPSASETCSDFRGAAYGLCVAACEASLQENAQGGKSAALEKLSALFESRTGEALPCLRNACVALATETCAGYQAEAITGGWDLVSDETTYYSGFICSIPPEPYACREITYHTVYSTIEGDFERWLYYLTCPDQGFGYCILSWADDFAENDRFGEKYAVFCDGQDQAHVYEYLWTQGNPRADTDVCRAGTRF